MKTVKVLTVDLDITEAKVKLDDIEAQLDRILDKYNKVVESTCHGCNVNEVIKVLEQLKCR